MHLLKNIKDYCSDREIDFETLKRILCFLLMAISIILLAIGISILFVFKPAIAALFICIVLSLFFGIQLFELIYPKRSHIIQEKRNEKYGGGKW